LKNGNGVQKMDRHLLAVEKSIKVRGLVLMNERTGRLYDSEGWLSHCHSSAEKTGDCQNFAQWKISGEFFSDCSSCRHETVQQTEMKKGQAGNHKTETKQDSFSSIDAMPENDKLASGQKDTDRQNCPELFDDKVSNIFAQLGIRQFVDIHEPALFGFQLIVARRATPSKIDSCIPSVTRCSKHFMESFLIRNQHRCGGICWQARNLLNSKRHRNHKNLNHHGSD
jgi:hypothetical protein